MTENFEIFLYVPVGGKTLPEQDLIWVNNFSKIFQIGLTQFHQAKIKIISTIFSKDEVKKAIERNSIIIQILLNENIDITSCIQNLPELDKINKDQVIQLNCYPFKKDSLLNDSFKIINFYDEILNKSIKLEENIEKIKDDAWLKLLDLSMEIKRLVNELSKNKKKEVFSKSIFLAYTSPDQNVNRLIIEREIKQLGYNILDPSKSISSEHELRNTINDSLNKSDLSIHIIGNSELPSAPGQDMSIIEYQNKLFVEYVNANKNAKIFRLVWIPPDIKPKTEKQRMYIESFMHQVEAMENTEIVQTPIEIFKTIIQRKLIDRPVMTAENIKSTDGNSKSVYIIYNDSAIDKVNKISSEFEKKNITVLKTEKAQNNIETIRLHHKNLINCDVVLIFQNEDNRLWLNSKISDILKAPGIGRKKRYIAKAIYPVNSTSGISNSLKDLIILDNKVSISESILPIIEILEKYDTSR